MTTLVLNEATCSRCGLPRGRCECEPTANVVDDGWGDFYKFTCELCGMPGDDCVCTEAEKRAAGLHSGRLRPLGWNKHSRELASNDDDMLPLPEPVVAENSWQDVDESGRQFAPGQTGFHPATGTGRVPTFKQQTGMNPRRTDEEEQKQIEENIRKLDLLPLPPPSTDEVELHPVRPNPYTVDEVPGLGMPPMLD